MGITIESDNFSVDMGYGGFDRFRKRVASLSHSEFGTHYEALGESMFLMGDERDAFYKIYNEKTNKLLKDNIITAEIANFCYQSDSEGFIDQEQAKQIYEKIKDYDDDICYGDVERPDCAMFSDLKSIFKDCAENGGMVKWS